MAKCEVCGSSFTWLQLQRFSLAFKKTIACKHCKTSYQLRGFSLFVLFLLVCVPMILVNHKIISVVQMTMIIFAVLLVAPFIERFKRYQG
uniref:Cxxc_20_cxxc protein n=1 Tax=Paenibacillus athensensis TaxID=1967502 RepID=A0A4Y8Q083_9BACL